MNAQKKWSDARGRLVPPDQEGAAAEGRRALGDALRLAELRSQAGVTQVELAERLGKSQGNVSEIEHRGDVYLSTLREYVEALGGRLEVAAVFEESTQLIDLMGALEASVKQAKEARAEAAAPEATRARAKSA